MGLSQYPIQEVARAFRELRGGDPLPSFHTEGVVDVGPDPDVNPERVNLAPHQLRHLPKADPIPKRLTTIVEPWRRDMNLQQAHHPQAVGPLEGGKSVRLLLRSGLRVHFAGRAIRTSGTISWRRQPIRWATGLTSSASPHPGGRLFAQALTAPRLLGRRAVETTSPCSFRTVTWQSRLRGSRPTYPRAPPPRWGSGWGVWAEPDTLLLGGRTPGQRVDGGQTSNGVQAPWRGRPPPTRSALHPS